MNQNLFQTYMTQLKRWEGLNTAVLDAIQHWVLNTDISKRARINPYHISLDCHVDQCIHQIR